MENAGKSLASKGFVMRVVWVQRVALVAGMASGVACAADVGDAFKGDGGVFSGDEVTSEPPPADGGAPHDSSVPPQMDSTQMPLPDVTVPEDTSTSNT